MTENNVPQQLKFATCTYQEFHPDMGLPVRTTVGAPRFKLSYQYVTIRSCTPDYGMLKADLPEDEFRRRYRAKMHRNMNLFLREAATLAEAHGWARLVLLCFDRLNKPGVWCHRTFLRELLVEETGLHVPELGATPVPTKPATGPLF